jgi:hypothetical protein
VRYCAAAREQNRCIFAPFFSRRQVPDVVLSNIRAGTVARFLTPEVLDPLPKLWSTSIVRDKTCHLTKFRGGPSEWAWSTNETQVASWQVSLDDTMAFARGGEGNWHSNGSLFRHLVGGTTEVNCFAICADEDRAIQGQTSLNTLGQFTIPLMVLASEGQEVRCQISEKGARRVNVPVRRFNLVYGAIPVSILRSEV